MDTDPVRMIEAMLSTSGVRVVEIYEEAPGLRVEIETSETTAACPICGGEAELGDLQTVELGEHSALVQRVHLEWLQRQWRCTTASRWARSWPEPDKGMEAFLVRSPHCRVDRSEQ